MAGNSVERVSTGMTVFAQQLATAHLAQMAQMAQMAVMAVMAVMVLHAEITQNHVGVASDHPHPGR